MTKSKACRAPAPVGYTAGTKRPLRSPQRKEPLPKGPPPKASPPPECAPAEEAPLPKKNRQEYSEDEIIEMRNEHEAAVAEGLSWQQRGPPPSHGPLWRNQTYRVGSERWANRGGGSASWFTAFYRAKNSFGQDKQGLARWVDANPKPRKP